MTRLEFSYKQVWQFAHCTETILIMGTSDCYHWMVTAYLYMLKDFLAMTRKPHIIALVTVT